MLRTLQDDIRDLKHEISNLRSDLHGKEPAAIASDNGGHNGRTIEVSNNLLSRLEVTIV